MKLSKTDYRGGEALTLSSAALELVVTTSVGPRVTSFRSLRGRAGNLFIEFPANEQRYHGFFLRGGHRLWHSPEDIVRTYQPDDEPLDVRLLPNGVSLAQPTEKATGLQKAVKVEFQGARTVKVTHTLSNRGLWSVECSAWALTMLRGGGEAVLPLLPKGSHEGGDLLPTYSLVPWSFTDLSQPLWTWGRDFIGVSVKKARSAQKLGITNYPGWSAYWNEGTTFVKFARPLASAMYPDNGCCFELFTNGQLVELETLSPLTKIEPGRSVTHVEFWTAIDGLDRPDSDRTFSKLAATVRSWLKTV